MPLFKTDTPQPSCYLRARQVRSGDILLTGHKPLVGFKRGNVGIQLATWSKWTHAGIICSATGLLQATTFGDFAVLTSLPVIQDAHGEPLLEVNAEIAMILRPTAALLSQWKERSPARPTFDLEIESLALAYLGKDYATQSRIVQFVPRFLRPVVKSKLAKLKPDSKSSIILQGLCCSELVEWAYRDAGLPLTDRRYPLISPGSIARNENLEKIEKAVHPSPNIPDGQLASDFGDIEGYLNTDHVDPEIRNAMAHYVAGRREAAISVLDYNLMNLINRPSNDLRNLYDYERNLRKRGLL